MYAIVVIAHRPHVLIKLQEVIAPLIANAYADGAILAILTRVFVVTCGFHSTPGAILGRMPKVVGCHKVLSLLLLCCMFRFSNMVIWRTSPIVDMFTIYDP